MNGPLQKIRAEQRGLILIRFHENWNTSSYQRLRKHGRYQGSYILRRPQKFGTNFLLVLMPNVFGFLRKNELCNCGLNNLDMIHHPDVHIKGKF